jgi:hypothetical protein
MGRARRECFVIMPFGKGLRYEKHLNRYEKVIRKAVEGVRINRKQAFDCVRADTVRKTGSITRDVLLRLKTADVVLADLTDLNANVFYELGVRHSLRSGTILLVEKQTTLPFNVKDLRVIPYEDRIGGESEAIRSIQSTLVGLLGESKQKRQSGASGACGFIRWFHKGRMGLQEMGAEARQYHFSYRWFVA